MPVLRAGEIPLDVAQAHHVRDVLRLPSGTEIDVFDTAGATARGILRHSGSGDSAVCIAALDPGCARPCLKWTVASAVPKGDRADWMVEKLSELGASAFIPLICARSVVLPQGRSKCERWNRLATESAKQSRRNGIMRIEELMPLETALKRPGPHWAFTTEIPALPIREAIANIQDTANLMLFIGPEGGWTNEELALFQSSAVTPVRLGDTILRIETAAIAAGAIVAAMLRAALDE